LKQNELSNLKSKRGKGLAAAEERRTRGDDMTIDEMRALDSTLHSRRDHPHVVSSSEPKSEKEHITITEVLGTNSPQRQNFQCRSKDESSSSLSPAPTLHSGYEHLYNTKIPHELKGGKAKFTIMELQRRANLLMTNRAQANDKEDSIRADQKAPFKSPTVKEDKGAQEKRGVSTKSTVINDSTRNTSRKTIEKLVEKSSLSMMALQRETDDDHAKEIVVTEYAVGGLRLVPNARRVHEQRQLQQPPGRQIAEIKIRTIQGKKETPTGGFHNKVGPYHVIKGSFERRELDMKGGLKKVSSKQSKITRAGAEHYSPDHRIQPAEGRKNAHEQGLGAGKREQLDNCTPSLAKGGCSDGLTCNNSLGDVSSEQSKVTKAGAERYIPGLRIRPTESLKKIQEQRLEAAKGEKRRSNLKHALAQERKQVAREQQLRRAEMKQQRQDIKLLKNAQAKEKSHAAPNLHLPRSRGNNFDNVSVIHSTHDRKKTIRKWYRVTKQARKSRNREDWALLEAEGLDESSNEQGQGQYLKKDGNEHRSERASITKKEIKRSKAFCLLGVWLMIATAVDLVEALQNLPGIMIHSLLLVIGLGALLLLTTGKHFLGFTELGGHCAQKAKRGRKLDNCQRQDESCCKQPERGKKGSGINKRQKEESVSISRLTPRIQAPSLLTTPRGRIYPYRVISMAEARGQWWLEQDLGFFLSKSGQPKNSDSINECPHTREPAEETNTADKVGLPDQQEDGGTIDSQKDQHCQQEIEVTEETEREKATIIEVIVMLINLKAVHVQGLSVPRHIARSYRCLHYLGPIILRPSRRGWIKPAREGEARVPGPTRSLKDMMTTVLQQPNIYDQRRGDRSAMRKGIPDQELLESGLTLQEITWLREQIGQITLRNLHRRYRKDSPEDTLLYPPEPDELQRKRKAADQPSPEPRAKRTTGRELSEDDEPLPLYRRTPPPLQPSNSPTPSEEIAYVTDSLQDEQNGEEPLPPYRYTPPPYQKSDSPALSDGIVSVQRSPAISIQDEEEPLPPYRHTPPPYQRSVSSVPSEEIVRILRSPVISIHDEEEPLPPYMHTPSPYQRSDSPVPSDEIVRVQRNLVIGRHDEKEPLPPYRHTPPPYQRSDSPVPSDEIISVQATTESEVSQGHTPPPLLPFHEGGARELISTTLPLTHPNLQLIEEELPPYRFTPHPYQQSASPVPRDEDISSSDSFHNTSSSYTQARKEAHDNANGDAYIDVLMDIVTEEIAAIMRQLIRC